MTLRHIVPALGFIACAAGTAAAADRSDVTWGGWIDATLRLTDDNAADDPATTKDEAKPTARFTSLGAINARWQPADSIRANINVWFVPTSNVNAVAYPSIVTTGSDWSSIVLREAYLSWDVTEELTWRFGKYISPIGWIAEEPTGLYRVNTSTIGYTRIYGYDILGAALTYAPKRLPEFSGTVSLTNGYFSANDAGVLANNRENDDLGVGVDLVYKPSKAVKVRFDAAFDQHSSIDSPNDLYAFGVNNGFGAVAGTGTTKGSFARTPALSATEQGGSVFLIGANATIAPTEPLTLGAEVLYFHIADGDVVDSNYRRLQGLVAANYVLPKAMTPCPMSVTGMVQHIDGKDGADNKGTATEISASLLTNPLKSENFGLNYEVAYSTASTDQGTGESGRAWGVFIEGLVRF